MIGVRRVAVLLTAAVLATWLARAATLDSVIVTYESGRYGLEAEAFMDAPRESIFAVLVDYERIGRLSRAYKEYGFMDPAPDGTPIVFTRLEGCVLIFCRSLRRVERLEGDEPGYIRTVMLPEQSDFSYGLAQWWLVPEATGTRVTYHLEMEPDFWVPPLIGPWILQRRLKRGGEAAVGRIERLALGLPAEPTSL